MPKVYIIIFLVLSSFWMDLQFIIHSNKFTLKFLDVGQGDAILIRTPSNCTVLIDGGPGNNLTDDLYKSLPVLENKIDLLVLSHPHADHLDGLIKILNRYKVESVFTTGIAYPSSSYQEFNRLLAISEAEVYYPVAGDFYALCGLEIEIKYPLESLIGSEINNLNNSSIVLRIKLGDTWVYLTGDAEQEVEAEIIESGQILRSDIMKAGHHGSRTSNSLEILKEVNPRELVIQSATDNQFSHPHPETLEKARSLGVKVKRNDIRGTITYYF